jgi:hypothetical protein
MKHLPLLLLFIGLSIPAFAQFPLGSSKNDIKAYFAQNVPYSSLQEYKTADGNNALCFTKTRVIGDYTFYFDADDKCTLYVVTYDKNDLNNTEHRFDSKFCRLSETKWESEEGVYDVSLLPPDKGANYFSVVYKPTSPTMDDKPTTLAAN